jgi:hypothetical protein
MKTAVNSWMNRSRTGAIELGPYVVVALLMPGGTVFAALLWLYRHFKSAQAKSAGA